MGIINRLDTFTSNRIAAGEVVERPASVVKELVENSLDARSTAVTIEIRGGGISYVRVTDNGTGIYPDDATVAFERHATSKINAPRDLDGISTLGFRGEALASIAAVSQTELKTRVRGEQSGFAVTIRGGEVVYSGETGCPEGTTMIVTNLFYNTPARVKFLKKPPQEAAYIGDYVLRLILARPDVSFRFINSEKLVYQSPGDGSIGSAIFCVYGKEVLSALKPVELSRDGITVSGVISRSDCVRPNRTFESFFVNGRYIKSPLLSGALQNAYGQRIMGGRFPICALNISVDFSSVDVNIHPNKLDVRFSDETAVYKLVYDAAEQALGSNAPLEWSAPANAEKPRVTSTLYGNISNDRVSESVIEPQTITSTEQTRQPAPCDPVNSSVIESALPTGVQEKQATEPNESINESDTQSFDVSRYFKPTQKIDDSHLRTFSAQSESVSKQTLAVREAEIAPKFDIKLDQLRIVGQVFGTYLIVTAGTDMFMLDQHAAHERLLYDALCEKTRVIASQPLLVPSEAALSPEEYEAFQANIDTLRSLGFDFAEKENLLIDITAAPVVFENAEPSDFLHDALDDLINLGATSAVRLKHERLAQLACKHAVKGNYSMADSEIQSLLEQFSSCEHLTCPHGRPIVVRFTKTELEKLFKRQI